MAESLDIVKSLFSGGRFLKKTPFLPRDQMREWQWKRVVALVAHAYADVPFYRELYDAVGFKPGDLRDWRDFDRLPLVTKDDVIAHYPEKMLAKSYSLDQLMVSRSSGSSGKVMDICYDSRALAIFVLAGLRLYRMGFPYRPWHRQLYIYTSPYPMDSLLGAYPMDFVPTLAPLEDIVQALERKRPELLVCYPSHLKQIEPALSSKVRKRLRCVSVNSEMSTQAERDDLAKRLGCPVLDEYSSEELTRIAAQCSCGVYHIFEDINYLECLPREGLEESAPGIVVGTNLHNFGMPLIRYVQNDLASIREGTCACGWKFRQLVNLQGRKNDSFLMPSGRELSSGFLLDATYDILLTWRTAVRDFCLIQESPDRVLLQVIPNEGWNEELGRSIGEKFDGYFEEGVVFRIEVVKECEKTKTGKRNPIIRRFQRTGRPEATDA